MLYSIKMRAAQGATHEQGGRHISGAERLCSDGELEQLVQKMLQRAREHERGRADFINIKISTVDPDSFITAPALVPTTLSKYSDIADTRHAAKQRLIAAGVSEQAICTAFERLTNLTGSLRGALLVYAHSGQVVAESDNSRGIRVSNMDARDKVSYLNWLNQKNIQGIHAQEAIILASKVASCPDVIAELCWSDDPDYTTGYVADQTHYYRLAPFKPLGCDIGGRVFFVKETANLQTVINYLQNQTVLIEVPNVTK